MVQHETRYLEVGPQGLRYALPKFVLPLQIQILWEDLKLTRCPPLQLHCKLLLTPHPPGHRALYKVPSAPGGQELRGSPLWVARCPAIS